MKNILEEIIAFKHKEVAERKELYPTKLLEQSIYFETKPVSMKEYILREDKSGIIAEIKRKSPSKGMINEFVDVEQTSIGYMQAGASAISVLTDTKFFGSKNEDLMTARKYNFCPILRKDFMIDEYQIIEAKSIGADTILLIAAAISPELTYKLAKFAKSLGLETLLEVHSIEEFNTHFNNNIDMVGVNNRNLSTFEVSIENSKNIASIIPDNIIKISESGIDNPENIIELKQHGFNGFLIGETFMKTGNPNEACRQFIKQINQLS